MKSSAVFGQAGLCITALITDALYASPSWMSAGFSSEYAAAPGLTMETSGSAPDRQSARKSGKCRSLWLDALLDRFSAALQTRRGKVTAAAADPAVSAVMVRINLEIGLASETLRTMLQTDKGRDMLDAGLKKLAARIVGELIK